MKIGMKLGMPMLMVATLVCIELTSPARLCAQGPRYKVIDLGTSGGPQSYLYIPDQYARVLNNSGAVAGWADTSTFDSFPSFCFDQDCLVSKAFQWQDGVHTDLDELVPGFSNQANWINAGGLVAGFAENGEIDPLISGFPETHAVLWNNGGIVDLGTLAGGYESIASAVNSKGQVAGWAQNTIPDSNSMACPGFCTTETRAFLWQNGMIQDLGTLQGGTDAMALLINDLGQVVGNSYTKSKPSAYCAKPQIGFPLTTGAFIWQEGKMKDLGNFGGTCTLASALNNLGQVVGLSTLKDDVAQHPFLWDGERLKDLGTFGGSLGNAIAISDTGKVAGWASVSGDQAQHAFLWEQGAMTDLGILPDTLPDLVNSFAVDVNSSGQIIGFLADSQLANFRAFVWQKGLMYDLDALIASSGLQLGSEVANINDLGEIAGNATDVNNQSHAVLLVPCDANDSDCPDATADTKVRPAPAITSPTKNLNNAMRLMLRRRLAPLEIPSAKTSPGPTSPDGASGAPKDSTPILRTPPLPIVPPSLRQFPGRCTREGMECPPIFPPCCAGLTCVPESTRAFCLRI